MIVIFCHLIFLEIKFYGILQKVHNCWEWVAWGKHTTGLSSQMAKDALSRTGHLLL